MRLFYGIEAEGPWKGCYTLFISDPSIEIKELFIVLGKVREYQVEQLYFGAGNNRQIPTKILNDIPSLSKQFRIIFEIYNPHQLKYIPDHLFKYIHVVLCLLIDETKMEEIKSVKLLGKTKLSWLGPVEPIMTDLSDSHYNNDKEIQ